MALTVAQLVARLTADTSGFYRGMALANSSMIRTGGVIGRVAAGAGLAVAGMGILSLRSAGNFQESMNILQAVSGATEGQFKALHDEAIALGRDMKLPNVSAKDAAEAMQELSKAGLSVKDIMGATRGALQLGIATNTGFADSAAIVARSLTAFNLKGDQATRVADLFTAAANKSTASAQDIALGFQMASAQFAAGDQTIQGLSTSLAIMANASITGSDAGTSLKTMMNRLMAPTAKASKEMERLGFSAYDASGNFKSMPDIIGDLDASLVGMSKAQRNATLYTIFGSDAIRAARVQLAAGEKGWRKMEERITKGGEAQAFAEARTKGFNGAVQALFSQVETLAIELGEHMLPAAEDITRAMARFVAAIDPDKVAAFFGAIAGGVKWVIELVRGSDLLQYALVALAGALTGMFVMTKIIGMIQAMKIAMLALNATMLANPFVLAAAAIVALGAAFFLAYQKSEQFRAIVDAVFSWIRDNVVPIVMQVVQAIRTHWGSAVEFIKTALNTLRTIWEQTWGRILSFVIQNWDKISAVIRAVMALVLNNIKHTLGIIQGIFDVIMGVISGDWGRAWDGIKKIASNAIQLVFNIVKITLTRLVPAVLSLALAAGKAILTGIGNGIANLASWLWEKLQSGISSAISSVAGWVGGAAAAIGRAIVDGVLSGITGLAQRLGNAIGNAAKGALGIAKGALGIGSPSRLAASEVGEPIGQGIIVGFLTGANDLPAKISEKLKAALEAGKKVVEEYQNKFKEAWSEMASDALDAFDRITETFRTAGERALAAFDLRQARLEAQKEMQELVKAVTDAQLALQMHAAGGVPQLTREEGETDEAFNARQAEANARFQEEQNALLKTYNDAQIALEEERHQRKIEKQRLSLEQQAEKERANYEQRRGIQRRHLERELEQLMEYLLKHPQEHRKTQNKIIALLHSYGVSYRDAGSVVGENFAQGLLDSMPAVVDAANQMAGRVSRILRTASPTKEGPMSDLDRWWDSFGTTLVSGLDKSPIERAALAIAGAMRPSAGGGYALGATNASLAGAGAVTYVTYYVEGSLIREQELNDRIREGVNTEFRRGRTISV